MRDDDIIISATPLDITKLSFLARDRGTGTNKPYYFDLMADYREGMQDPVSYPFLCHYRTAAKGIDNVTVKANTASDSIEIVWVCEARRCCGVRMHLHYMPETKQIIHRCPSCGYYVYEPPYDYGARC